MAVAVRSDLLARAMGSGETIVHPQPKGGTYPGFLIAFTAAPPPNHQGHTFQLAAAPCTTLGEMRISWPTDGFPHVFLSTCTCADCFLSSCMWIIWVIKAGAAAHPLFLNAPCINGWVMPPTSRAFWFCWQKTFWPINAAASSLPSEVNECSAVVLQTPAL